MPRKTKTKPPANDTIADLCWMRLNFIRRFASVEETRYYINGVHIEPHPDKGVVMIATDGHRMGIGVDLDGYVKKPMTLGLTGRATHEVLRRPRMREGWRITIHPFSAETVIARRPDENNALAGPTSPVMLVGGRFPEWRRVVPWGSVDIAPTLSVAIRPDLLRAFSEPLGNGMGATGVEIRQGDAPTDPLIIRRHDAEWFLGVLMPHRLPRPIQPMILALRPKS